MVPLKEDSIRRALLDLAPVYERDMNAEIEELVKIVDTSQERKTFAGQKQIQMFLIGFYGVYQHFKEIEDQVVSIITLKSKGQPLAAFYFTFQALTGNFLQVKNFKLISTSKFKYALKTDSMANFRLPYCIIKSNMV